MPLTQMDAVIALVVIDLQKGIVRMAADAASEIVERSAGLARTFRAKGLPVVLVNVAGGPAGRTDAGWPKMELPPDWAEIVPEMEQQPEDKLVTKHSWGAFAGTDLDAWLKEKGVTQILMTGVATSIGVESTARVAYDLGYNVVFVSDAMTDRSAEAHADSLERIFPRLGEIDTTENVLKMLHG